MLLSAYFSTLFFSFLLCSRIFVVLLSRQSFIVLCTLCWDCCKRGVHSVGGRVLVVRYTSSFRPCVGFLLCRFGRSMHFLVVHWELVRLCFMRICSYLSVWWFRIFSSYLRCAVQIYADPQWHATLCLKSSRHQNGGLFCLLLAVDFYESERFFCESQSRCFLLVRADHGLCLSTNFGAVHRRW